MNVNWESAIATNIAPTHKEVIIARAIGPVTLSTKMEEHVKVELF